MSVRLFTAGAGWWPAHRRHRNRAAVRRLKTARCGFEHSLIALRRAALDHIDSQQWASLTLRLCLDRGVRPAERGLA